MDDRLKQRIIGAIVLVIAAVIFLPMLLSGQDETVRVEVQPPEPPEMNPEPIIRAAPVELSEPEAMPETPTDLPSPASIEPSLPVEPEQTPAVATPEPAAPPATPASAPPATQAPTPAPQPAEVPAAATGGWVVQLGSFSSADNASALSAKLRTQGYNAYTVPSQVDGKSITRVFVGPVIDREGANRLRDELARRSGSKGLVVAHDADTRAR